MGIGTTDPLALLHLSFSRVNGSNGIRIEGDNTSDSRINIRNGPGGNHFLFDDQSEGNALVLQSSKSLLFSTNGLSERMRIDADGRVGIGKTPMTTPGLLLDVGGDIYANNNLISSDRRFKQNIQTLADVHDKLSQLRGVSYRFRQERFKDRNFIDTPQIGLIAQEVEAVFPELVRTDAEGFKAINYDGLIPVLIEAVKEQQTELQVKTEQIQELEAKLSRIEQLEALLAKADVLEARLAAVDQLENRIYELENQVQDCCRQGQFLPEQTTPSRPSLPTEGAYLKQNRPNPFNQQTGIEYYLPAGIQAAELYITDLNGKLLRTFDLAPGGIGSLELDGNLLPSGIYLYTLVVDGEMVNTKMVLTR